VGPRAEKGDVQEAEAQVRFEDGKVEVEGEGRGRGRGQRSGIWEVYAHDFEQSDVFARRVLGITNLVAGRRGWRGLLTDLVWAFVGEPLGRLWSRGRRS